MKFNITSEPKLSFKIELLTLVGCFIPINLIWDNRIALSAFANIGWLHQLNQTSPAHEREYWNPILDKHLILYVKFNPISLSLSYRIPTSVSPFLFESSSPLSWSALSGLGYSRLTFIHSLSSFLSPINPNYSFPSLSLSLFLYLSFSLSFPLSSDSSLLSHTLSHRSFSLLSSDLYMYISFSNLSSPH